MSTDDLHLTPTRRKVLSAVASDDVFRRMDVDGNLIDFWRLGPGDYQRVTARCAVMEEAGWIEPADPDDDTIYGKTPWRITETGRAVLDQKTGDADHLWSCSCLRNDAGAHRVGCPDHPEGIRGQR